MYAIADLSLISYETRYDLSLKLIIRDINKIIFEQLWVDKAKVVGIMGMPFPDLSHDNLLTDILKTETAFISANKDCTVCNELRY